MFLELVVSPHHAQDSTDVRTLKSGPLSVKTFITLMSLFKELFRQHAFL